jgi:hypothetical protein
LYVIAVDDHGEEAEQECPDLILPDKLWSTSALVSIGVRAIEILPFGRDVSDDF